MMFQRIRNPRPASVKVWPAPARGLVRNGTVIGADPAAAEVLENFIPTAQGARLRGGARHYASVPGTVEQLFTYRSGGAENLFAATETGIADVSGVSDPATIQPHAVDSMTSGDWSTVQFATAAGEFLIAVNGADMMQRFDGSDWFPVADEVLFDLEYDGMTAAFEVGETVIGGTSGAFASILGIYPTGPSSGVLRLGAITSGPFMYGEAITSAGGAAVADSGSSAGSTLKVDGVDTRLLSFVWSHKRRLWFVEKGTLSAWYLDVNSIAGTATEFPLAGVFRLGGSLLFGGTWSIDSGAGLDDVMVFVTTEGEIAVYQGTDPGTADDWSLTGVYKIGRPLNKRAWFRAGGDMAILTEDGIVPVSEALQKDRAALQASAITFPIEDLWQSAVAGRTVSPQFPVAVHSSKTLLLIGIPRQGGMDTALVANTRTGAWAAITGWDVRAAAVYGDRLYFGDALGRIAEADAGGNDFGLPYVGVYIPKFQEMNSADDKIALHARAIWRGAEDASPAVGCLQNYTLTPLPPPHPVARDSAALWGTAIWGAFRWGDGGVRNVAQDWQAVSGMGFALAPCMVVASDRVQAPTFEILSLHLRYEVGRAI